MNEWTDAAVLLGFWSDGGFSESVHVMSGEDEAVGRFCGVRPVFLQLTDDPRDPERRRRHSSAPPVRA